MNPLDIMIIMDRTGSMSSGGNPNKMTNAKNGIKTFLQFLDPTKAWVGLTVLPPSSSIANRCSRRATTTTSTASWTVVPLSSGLQGVRRRPQPGLEPGLDHQLPAAERHHALRAWRSTRRQQYLVANGRANVQNVIIFLTDGAANTAPHIPAYPAGHIYRTRPCYTGKSAGQAATAAGTWVYTIGYDVNPATENCQQDRQAGAESPRDHAGRRDQGRSRPRRATTSTSPTPGQLNTIFTAIAADISTGKSKLID